MRKHKDGSPRDSLRRVEQRLRYRWPVRFTTSPDQKQPFSGQLVDVSSRGMALLFHADESCPRPDQSVTADFGVPYFDSHGSFDTVFFSRIGRVCRVDNLSSRVNRVAIQFAEPLFFKPGEQNISEADAQQRLEARIRSVVQASQGPGTCNAAPAEAKLKTKVEKKAQSAAGKKVKAETEAQRPVQTSSEQIAQVKAEAAKEIARITAEAANAIARIEAEFKTEAATGDKARDRASRKKNSRGDAGQSEEGGLMKKVDTFLTDRSTVF